MFYQSPFAHRPIANVEGLFEENQSFHCTLSVTASAISKSNKLNLTMRKHTTNLAIDQALLNSASSNELASCWRSNPLPRYTVESIYRSVETTASQTKPLIGPLIIEFLEQGLSPFSSWCLHRPYFDLFMNTVGMKITLIRYFCAKSPSCM